MAGQALPIQELASRAAADDFGELTLDCAQGGKLKLRIDSKLAVEFSGVAGAGSAESSLKFKGKVEISGEVEDSIDVDVTQIVSATGLGQTSGSVTVKLTGTIKTSEATHTDDGTPIAITVESSLPRAEDEGKP